MNKRGIRFFSLILLLASLSVSVSSQTAGTAPSAGLSAATVQKIRAHVETILKRWSVAGAAVAIVKDGRVAFLEGFGRRDTAQVLPVTPKTRFILGSTTKAFTSLAVGLLVSDHKLDWDQPVAAYFPDFRLMDEYASLHATPRDLASHRTGLPRHDLIWINSPRDIGEMVRSLRFLEPSRELRSAFQYNNLMYITLGYLIDKTSGMPWDSFVRERIFKPLGMNDSGLTIPEYTAAAEYAVSYRNEGAKQTAQPLPTPAEKLMYGARASGSVNTTAEDMCRWMTVHLQSYLPGAGTAIPAAVLRETHKPQIPTPASSESPESVAASYGLGWMTDVYRGELRVHHGGSTLDFNSYVSLFPRARTGIVVLINANSPANNILANTVSDLALGLAPIDWGKRVEDQIKGRRAPVPDQRVEGTSPAHKLEDYAGEYIHPAYGTLTVEVRDGGLAAVIHGFSSPLDHWQYEMFRMASGDLRNTRFNFVTGADGTVASVAANFEPAVKDIVFNRHEKKD